ncbi:MAG: phosphoribosylglycinamide formyltransferase [Chitinophagales bacterium]
MVTPIAIFASGTGTNAQKIIDHFRNRKDVQVALILSNNPAAGVLKIAEREEIANHVIDKERFFRSDSYLQLLKEKKIEWIVLAGFLWKVPSSLIKAFPNRIINIHPALLPKYGGKGMYGARVHEAVLAAHDKESGITIHYVDEIYDHGKIIFQATCQISENDDPDSLAKKIHALEWLHFPKVIEELTAQKYS